MRLASLAIALIASATAPSSAIPLASVTETVVEKEMAPAAATRSPINVVSSPSRPAGAAKRIALESSAQHGPSGGWIKKAAAPASHKMTVHLGLRQRNVDALLRLVDDVSSPTSAKYGQHVSHEELKTLIAPELSTVLAVQQWVESFPGVSHKLTLTNDLLSVTAPVSTLNAMFDIELFQFGHPELGDRTTILRSFRPYSLPADVAGLIDFVDDVHRFPSLGRSHKTVESVTNGLNSLPTHCGCDNKVTPQTLIERYNITVPTSWASNVTQAVAEFQGQYYSPTDLSGFLSECQLSDNPVTKVVGPNQPDVPGTESTLDIEYIEGIAQGAPTWFWSLAQYSLYDWVTAVGQTADAPSVHSVSYGNDEAQNGHDYMNRTNVEFAKMAALGYSILFASGDQGAWGRSGEFVFHPDFPGASPYITTVGATQFVDSTIGHEVGTAWSGGGFSGIFSPPSYAEATFKNYFQVARALPNQGLFNNKGNGYPLLSAHGGAGGNPYCIYQDGRNGGVEGTSASTPVVAGMITILNNVRAQAGKSKLGFLNPLLFSLAASNPEVYDDITVGKNNGGGIIHHSGFDAAVGWDPITGFGNINLDKMSAAVANM